MLQSPEASLNASTSPSIASTVPMASPSIRRSARIQDSPSISYRDSLRSSVMRDTCTPVRQLGRRRSRSRSRSRIFGLDASDRSRLDKNSDSEVEEEGGKDPTANPYHQILMTKVIPVLKSPQGKGVAASLLLLFMLVFTQWVVGQGMTSIVSWVVGPLSGMRMAIMSLPDIVMGSVGGRGEINEVELVVKLMNSDKLREVIERVAEERMWEMERESDKRLRKEVEMMNNEVESMRRMFLDTEIKRLSIREEELKSDKAVQTGEGGDEGIDVGKDVLQKLELVEIQVEQMKFSLADFSKQLRDRRDLSELEEEIVAMKGVVEDINKERAGVAELDHRLGLMQQRVNDLGESRDGVSKLEKEVETIKQEMKKGEVGQSSTMEMVKEVLSDMLADPLVPVYEKAVVEMGKETDRLEDMVMELKVTVNQTEPKLSKTLTEKVGMMKINLMEELVQLTETLHSNWSRIHVDTTVSLPQVSALLDTQLSQYSADRTGQVDWASLALGGIIISTPNTTTHPAPGQGLSLLGFPLWQLSSSPTLILQQQSGDAQCWAFSGQAGQVVLQLAKVVRVTGITIEHVRPSPDLSNAPRNIVLWDHEDNTHLTNLTYSIATASSSVQTFPLPSHTSISKLRLEITSNWGHPEYTCLYRVRVHGVKEEVEDKKTVTELDSSVELM